MTNGRKQRWQRKQWQLQQQQARKNQDGKDCRCHQEGSYCCHQEGQCQKEEKGVIDIDSPSNKKKKQRAADWATRYFLTTTLKGYMVNS